MQVHDREEFAVLVAGLCEAFDKDNTHSRTQIYWMALEDMTLEQVKRGVATAIRSAKFMPKPGEIRELIEGNSEDKAITAWQSVQSAMPLGAYKHVSFNDRHVNAAVRTLGGWPALFDRCKDADGEKWYRLDFLKAYQSMRDTGVDGEVCAPLPGLSKATAVAGKLVEPSIHHIGGPGERLRIEYSQKRIERKSQQPEDGPKAIGELIATGAG